MADQRLRAPYLTKNAAFQFRSKLDGELRGFRMDWLARHKTWALSYMDTQGDLVFTEFLDVEIDILRAHQWRPEVPAGQLFVRRTNGAKHPLEREDFIQGAQLIYRPAADVEEKRGTAEEIR